MKNQLTLLVAAVVVVVLVAYMFCFQVRYDEVAVVTRFDHPSEDSIIRDPGLRLTGMPWPFTKVYKYSTRVQVLEDQLEELQTADNYAVIVQTYLAWRINDPLAFFTKLENIQTAERSLRPLMSDLKGLISGYRFDELANTNPERIQLANIEQQAAEQLQARIDAQGYGITVERVGVRRILLPENVTEKVFDRMKKTRERLAEQARSEGTAQAAAIRSEATSAQQRILAFAERRAQAIRAQGDHEAASYYSSFAQDEDFAIFLRKIEALRAMLQNNTTFVLNAKDITPLDLFVKSPEEMAASPAAVADTQTQASPTTP